MPRCDQMYSLPNVKDKRAAGIGYGTKYDFAKSVSATPAPNQYNFKSEMQDKTDKHLGWTIGIGREVHYINILVHLPIRDLPGCE